MLVTWKLEPDTVVTLTMGIKPITQTTLVLLPMATIIQISHTQPWYTWKQGCPIILGQQSLGQLEQ